ncbi:D-inositol 3-phosphate glycosyltransferase [Hartmannibacter diazotrophicus]|uniref:D-inositol 3-phosphate glycosyltransferase n=1 Tax=Hartmannibacter diazotrophicus TaxID=1482074 RepID=A0A2C9DBK4_9HYPH|nr:glycosyltransferase family 4 protein [Hartmannibacter diazotrophicus]SON57613.1 D-inositol 3-phosphate glycosyltransferase [Hartmannibacter diazotrophicus]
MSEVVFAIPGDIDTLSGGYGYDRKLIEGLRAIGWTVTHLALPDGFPLPDASTRRAAAEHLNALPDGTSILIDGLAFSAMPEEMAELGQRTRLTALIHHPLGLETGLDEETSTRLLADERAALRHARHVIVTSPETARTLAADFAVEPNRITVAVPGTEPGPRATGGNHPPHIVTVASLIPRKGHDMLVAALATLSDLNWRSSFVGSSTLDPAWAEKIRAMVAASGLEGRIAILDQRQDVRALMADADIFCLPSRYEGYGMAFAEAMSQGLPIVGCRAGAVPDVVTPDAGILVEPEDIPALAAALRTMLTDEPLRRRYAEGAFASGRQLPGWNTTAGIVAGVLLTR